MLESAHLPGAALLQTMGHEAISAGGTAVSTVRVDGGADVLKVIKEKLDAQNQKP